MKHIISLISVLLLNLHPASASIRGHEKTDTSSNKVCLDILGIAMDPGRKPIDGAEVKLYKENDEMEWVEVTSVTYHEHSFLFALEANEYYTIEVSKPGYVTRSVGISTVLPSGTSLTERFRYEFEVELFKERKSSDDYYLDFPVALISYDSKHGVFDNNNAYTKHIKTMIRQTTEVANNKTITSKK